MSMSRGSILILLGLSFILLPFSGIPSYVLQIIVPLLGTLTAVLGYQIRMNAKNRFKKNEESSVLEQENSLTET
jgi:hypothetical protein